MNPRSYNRGEMVFEAILVIAGLLACLIFMGWQCNNANIQKKDQQVTANIKALTDAANRYSNITPGVYPKTEEVSRLIPYLPDSVMFKNPFTRELDVINSGARGSVSYHSDGTKPVISGSGHDGLEPKSVKDDK